MNLVEAKVYILHPLDVFNNCLCTYIFTAKPLGLFQIASLSIVLICGFSISFIIFLGEYFTTRMKNQNAQPIDYETTLNSSLTSAKSNKTLVTENE